MNLFLKIRDKIKKVLQNGKNSHNWEHTERVYNLALKIAKKEKADIEIVKYAAILHDIKRTEEDRKNGKICHAKEGAKKAYMLLKKHGLSREKIKKIVHCIETHRFRGNKKPETKEAKVLFDADKLDSIGAVGIGRAFLFAGEVGAKLHNKGIEIKKTKPYTEEDTAYREYVVKLRKIKNKMQTKTGKKMAIKRHKFMVEFFKRLNKEVKGIV